MASIYVIDDDYASGLLVENLNSRGHAAVRVTSADEAIRDADQICGCDLVILDLIMPRPRKWAIGTPNGARSTGMLVFGELRRRRSNLPILVFTANLDPAVIDVIEADPYATYLSRWSSPSFHEFMAMVHQMLGLEATAAQPRSFIVHGHDDKTKLEVKNYLQNTLGLPEPIILHERPNLGRTLIEKFEATAATVDLAFVLLTPDDRVAEANASDPDKRRALAERDL